MNWLVFAISAFACLLVERATEGLNPFRGYEVYPSLLLVLLVFVGLQAQPMTVAWAGLALGLLVDLMYPGGGDAPAAVLGPAALGYLVGAYAVIQLRTLLFRDSTLTLAIMVFAVGIFVNLVEVAVYSFRQIEFLAGADIPGWSATDQLVKRFLRLVYSTIVAVPVGYLLLKTQPLWQFARLPRAADRNYS